MSNVQGRKSKGQKFISGPLTFRPSVLKSEGRNTKGKIGINFKLDIFYPRLLTLY